MKPPISYVICASPRSGCHLLGEALQNTGLAGVPDEYFICDDEGRMENEQGNIAQIYGQKTLDEFRDLVLQLGSTPNGVFGITIMGNYLDKVLRNFQMLPQYQGLEAHELFDELLCKPKYVWLTRRNKARQAVSWAKAAQTGVWSRSKGEAIAPQQKPEFDFAHIKYHYELILKAEDVWADFFRTSGIVPFKVVYEELVEAYEQTALSILDYLEIPYPPDLAFGERKLQRQANRLNDKWAARFNRMQKSPVRRLRLLARKAGGRIREIISPRRGI